MYNKSNVSLLNLYIDLSNVRCYHIIIKGTEDMKMKEKYTLKMFMEDYAGFDFELGTIVLFDADLCRQYFLCDKTYKEMYLTEERLSKNVYDWKHGKTIISIILKDQIEK